jgi:hypothetical protein
MKVPPPPSRSAPPPTEPTPTVPQTPAGSTPARFAPLVTFSHSTLVYDSTSVIIFTLLSWPSAAPPVPPFTPGSPPSRPSPSS